MSGKGLLLTLFFIIPHSAFGGEVSIQCLNEVSRNEVQVTITPRPLSQDQLSTNREILFHFDPAVHETFNTKIPSECAGFVGALVNGYDTLLFQVPSDKKISELKNHDGFVVTYRSDSPQAITDTERASLNIAQAYLLFDENAVDESFTLLEERLKKSRDADTLSAYGSNEIARGRIRSGLKYLKEAIAVDPTRKDIALLQKSAEKKLAPEVHASTEYIDGDKSFSEWQSTVSAKLLTDQTNIAGDYLEGEVSYNRARFRGLRFLNGDIDDVHANQERVRVSYGHPLQDEQEVVGSIYGSSETAGAGADYISRDRHGAWKGALHVQEVNWEYASTIAFDGTKDLVEVGREQFINSQLFGSVETAYQRYSLNDRSNIADSVALRGNLQYALLKAIPSITLSYRLDAEYFLDQKDMIDSFNQSYQMLGADSREFHVVSLGLNNSFTDFPVSDVKTDLGIFGGYGFNRLGDEAPEIGAVLLIDNPRGPEIRSDIGKTFSTVKDNSTQTRVNFVLIWQY